MKMKRFLSILLVVVITLSLFSFTAYTSDTDSDDTSSYFEFIPNDPNKRIDSNGDFTFKFNWSVDSTSFTPKKTAITISCITSTDSNSWFTVTLFDSSNNEIGSFRCTDNGREYSKTFNGLSTTTSYHFNLRKVNYFNNAEIIGSGHVTNLY